MADAKKDPPKLDGYDKDLDRSIDDLLKEYKGHTNEEAEDEVAEFAGTHSKAAAGIASDYLIERFGKNDKGKKNKYSLSHLKTVKEKEKEAQAMLTRIVKYGMKLRHPKSADALASDHELVKQHVEKYMVGGQFQNYESIIRHIANSKGWGKEFNKGAMKELLDSYFSNLHEHSVREDHLEKNHLGRVEHSDGLMKEANTYMKNAGYQFKKGTPAAVLYNTIKAGQRKGFKAPEPSELEYVEAIPKPK